MAIRIPVTLVIEMDDEQETEYVDKYGVGDFHDGKWTYRAKDVVEAVRHYALAEVQESAAFGLRYAAGVNPVGTLGATVTIKER